MIYGYGWLNFHGKGQTVLDAAHELLELKPEIDLIFCNVNDYVSDGVKGERCKLMNSHGSIAYLVPDPYVARGSVHGIKKPEKHAIEIGSTLA